MTIRSVLAKGLLGCFLVAAAGTAAAPAFAQHVVTDDEASKLTLDALTAVPRVVVHRAAYRPVRMGWSDGWSRDRGRSRSAWILHEASYRHSVRATGMTLRLGAGSHRRRRS